MNLSLDIIKTSDKQQKYMLMKYGHYFYNNNVKLKYIL